MLARAAHYPGVTDAERTTLIRFGAPNIPTKTALEWIERAQQLGLEYRHLEAQFIIDQLADGQIPEAEAWG